MRGLSKCVEFAWAVRRISVIGLSVAAASAVVGPSSARTSIARKASRVEAFEPTTRWMGLRFTVRDAQTGSYLSRAALVFVTADTVSAAVFTAPRSLRVTEHTHILSATGARLDESADSIVPQVLMAAGRARREREAAGFPYTDPARFESHCA